MTDQTSDSDFLWGDPNAPVLKFKHVHRCKRGLIDYTEPEPFGDLSVEIKKGLCTCSCWRGKLRERIGAFFKWVWSIDRRRLGWAFGVYMCFVEGFEWEQ